MMWERQWLLCYHLATAASAPCQSAQRSSGPHLGRVHPDQQRGVVSDRRTALTECVVQPLTRARHRAAPELARPTAARPLRAVPASMVRAPVARAAASVSRIAAAASAAASRAEKGGRQPSLDPTGLGRLREDHDLSAGRRGRRAEAALGLVMRRAPG